MIEIHSKHTTVDGSGIDSAREVLLYDHSVADVKVLLAGLKPDCGRLPLNGSPVESLVAAISSPHLRVLHILCHGAPGRILVDGVTYSNELFEVAAANASASSEFFQGRAVDGERQIQINFWSCNVGHGEQGMRFLSKVSSAMNAQVNASEGKVGPEDLGGSWELSTQVSLPVLDHARIEFRQVLSGGVFNNSSAITQQLYAFQRQNPGKGSEDWLQDTFNGTPPAAWPNGLVYTNFDALFTTYFPAQAVTVPELADDFERRPRN